MTPTGRWVVLHRQQAVPALLKQKVLTANLGTQPGLVTTASKDRVVIVCARQAAEDHVPVVLYEPPVSIQAKWQ